MAEEAILKRVLPHSIEAEQSVIGSMIMDKDAIVTASEILHGDDFYSKQYGIIFDAMVELHDSAQPVDLITLQKKTFRRKSAVWNLSRTCLALFRRVRMLPIMPISLRRNLCCAS